MNTNNAYDSISDNRTINLHKPNLKLTAKQFKRWQDCIETRCGLYFDESRVQFLCSALVDRIGKLNLEGYEEYLRYLLYSVDSEREWNELYCALVNCETSFFRHEPSYNILQNNVFPQLLENKKDVLNKVLTIWSVGCSSGQEAYSIALSALDSYDTDEFYTKIIGSDINLHLLKQARKGIYDQSEVKSISPGIVDKYMFPYISDGQTLYKFRDEVKDLVSFNFINLVEPVTYKMFSVDVVFCQNVLFYFSQRTRQEIIRRLSEYIVRDGCLILGPSDMMPEQIDGMETLNINNYFIYKKL